MKKIIILFISVILVSCNNSLSSTKVQEIVSSIQTEKKVNSNLESSNYKKLLSTATNNDLVILTDNENPIVKYYACKGLLERDYSEIRDIYSKHKNDKTTICITNGACLTNFILINETLLSGLNPKSSSKHKFTEVEFEKEAEMVYGK